MIYSVILLVVLIGYYTFTYGAYVLIKEKNTLGGCAVIALAALSTVASIIFIIVRA